MFMTANRLGPSFCPPYHRVTTTMTSQTSIICRSLSTLPPAALSPSSSQSWKLAPRGPRTRHAVMLCVAARAFLSVASRCATYALACAGDVTAAARARNVDLSSVSGSESVHGGGACFKLAGLDVKVRLIGARQALADDLSVVQLNKLLEVLQQRNVCFCELLRKLVPLADGQLDRFVARLGELGVRLKLVVELEQGHE
ncbi:hypothetical protein BN1723_000202 [Verticillium longisporum]|uniref:Uncharacterized protein n=1 Tax=Verticillium longisporum TaxID=100787 RepID=A0A0G4KEQ1_VERLO|nr:hypothetical protein BN1723_000202 [Verticillium longisporum]